MRIAIRSFFVMTLLAIIASSAVSQPTGGGKQVVGQTFTVRSTTPLMSETTVLATVATGTSITVEKTNGSWLYTTVDVSGKTYRGWVSVDAILPQTNAPKKALQPDPNATSVVRLNKPKPVLTYKGISIDSYLKELSTAEFDIPKMFEYVGNARSGDGFQIFVLLAMVPPKSRELLTGKDAIPAIRQLLIRGNANARCWALLFAQFVPKTASEDAIPEMLHLLSDPDKRVRKLAAANILAFALSDKQAISDDRCVEAILPLLNDKDEAVKTVAEAGLAALVTKKQGGDWQQYIKGAAPTATADFPLRNQAQTVAKDVSPAESPLPKATALLASGRNPIRIVNPNRFDVWVGVRANNGGRDFLVKSGATETTFVADGEYHLWFFHSDSAFVGDSVNLNQNGVEIRIVNERTGNYSIRPVGN